MEETISGTLCSGDSWTIDWKCTYKLDSKGIPRNGKVFITTSANTADTDAVEELDLCSGEGAQGFPWELAPYSVPKSSITRLSISGSPKKRLRITENAFKGYSSLGDASFTFVSDIGGGAFENCNFLRSVSFYGTSVSAIGSRAFKNCILLADMDFPPELEQIGAEAFWNTSLETITLGRGVREIGKDAFSECEDLLILCYEGSHAHQYAKAGSLPFRLIPEDGKPVHIYYGDGKAEGFDHDLEYYISQTASDTYSPKLSHMLIALSNAVHNERSIKDSMKELGFRYKDMYSSYSENEWRDEISYAFGKKTLSNGKTLVLVTIRGTVTKLEDQSNFDLGPSVLGCFWHKGFETAANAVYNDLKSFAGGDFGNTTFVITGHSRGAAAANLLEVMLFNDKVPNADVYGYNFACPDVAAGLPTGWNYFGEHNNMFNIGNSPDVVSVMPGVLGTALLSVTPLTGWGKFGQSRWFSKDWSNLSETTTEFFSIEKHYQEVYLAYLRKEPSFDSFKTWEERNAIIGAYDLQTIGTLTVVRCPVDVTVADGSGNPVASVTGGVPNYYGSQGRALIFTSGDRKAVFVKGTEPLEVRLTATGSGSMEYIVQSINADTGEIAKEKAFANVGLVEGRQMASYVDAKDTEGTGIQDVQLFVLDNDGEPEKEVLPDGSGTEIPVGGMGDVLPEDIPASGRIPDGLWIPEIRGYSYTGKAIKPEVHVYDSDKRLKAGKDYTISYKNNINANNASNPAKAPTVTVKGKGNYSGTETALFQIQPVSLNDVVTEDITTAYNGKVQKKVPIITFNGRKLSNGKDFTVSYPAAGTADAYKAVGTYDILITAKDGGNFTGTRTVALAVTGSTLISRAAVKKIPDQTYTGNPVEPEPVLTYKKATLVKDTDYTVAYDGHNTETGTAAVIITGIGAYAGTRKVTFRITGTPLKNAKVTGLENKEYNREEQQQRVNVTLGGKTLTDGTDYEVLYANHKNAGKATVTIKGIHAYTGTIKKTFQITAYDLGADAGNQIKGLDEITTAKYAKGGSKPKPQLTFAGKTLTEGIDYTVSYQNNKTVTLSSTKKQPTMTIKGRGNFKGTLSKSFTITGKALNDSESPVSLTVPDKGFANKAGNYASNPELTDTDGMKLAAGKDYEKAFIYTLEDGTELTNASTVPANTNVTIKVTGKGAYSGELTAVYRITEKDFGKAKISISPQIYTGKCITLDKDSITVKMGNNTLTYGTDYEIVEGSYINNVEKGTAKVSIIGKGSYGGTKTAQFRITAKKFSWFWRLIK